MKGRHRRGWVRRASRVRIAGLDGLGQAATQYASAFNGGFPRSSDLCESDTFTRVALDGVFAGFQRLEAHRGLVGKVLDVKTLAQCAAAGHAVGCMGQAQGSSRTCPNGRVEGADCAF